MVWHNLSTNVAADEELEQALKSVGLNKDHNVIQTFYNDGGYSDSNIVASINAIKDTGITDKEEIVELLENKGEILKIHNQSAYNINDSVDRGEQINGWDEARIRVTAEALSENSVIGAVEADSIEEFDKRYINDEEGFILVGDPDFVENNADVNTTGMMANSLFNSGNQSIEYNAGTQASAYAMGTILSRDNNNNANQNNQNNENKNLAGAFNAIGSKIGFGGVVDTTFKYFNPINSYRTKKQEDGNTEGDKKSADPLAPKSPPNTPESQAESSNRLFNPTKSSSGSNSTATQTSGNTYSNGAAASYLNKYAPNMPTGIQNKTITATDYYDADTAKQMVSEAAMRDQFVTQSIEDVYTKHGITPSKEKIDEARTAGWDKAYDGNWNQFYADLDTIVEEGVLSRSQIFDESAPYSSAFEDKMDIIRKSVKNQTEVPNVIGMNNLQRITDMRNAARAKGLDFKATLVDESGNEYDAFNDGTLTIEEANKLIGRGGPLDVAEYNRKAGELMEKGLYTGLAKTPEDAYRIDVLENMKKDPYVQGTVQNGNPTVMPDFLNKEKHALYNTDPNAQMPDYVNQDKHPLKGQDINPTPGVTPPVAPPQRNPGPELLKEKMPTMLDKNQHPLVGTDPNAQMPDYVNQDKHPLKGQEVPIVNS